MKIILFIFLLISIFFTSCNVFKGKTWNTVRSTDNNKLKYIIKSEKISNETFSKTRLLFEGWFDNDTIIVIINDNQFFYGVISTDESMGIAKDITLPENSNEEILLKINNFDTTTIKIGRRYQFVRIMYSNINNEVNVILTNKEVRYW
jgi:hypothetical protein